MNTLRLGYIPKVYMGFTCMLGLATLGVALTIMLEISSTVSMWCGLSSIVVLLYGMYNMYYGKIIIMEICAYLVSLLLGINMVPLILAAHTVDPSIVLLVFTGATVIFSTTTGYVYIWDPFKNNVNGMFFLGQALCSWLFLSIFATVVNIYFQSETLYLMEIYLSLAAFTLFVAYDTGMMIEKCRCGIVNPNHYIMDSLNLFLNFANIFVKLLQIFAYSKEKKSKDKKK